MCKLINSFDKIEDLFLRISNFIDSQIEIYIIGGAALLYRGLKASTKDIDIVVSNKKEFFRLESALVDFGFSILFPSKEYKNMNLSQILQMDDFRIDLFYHEVCVKFSLTKTMQNRSNKILDFDNLKLFICSNEDIFLFKTMTEREGDITDCINISISSVLDWNIILEELKLQIKNSKKDIWITWIGERFDILISRKLDIPIIGEINKLRDDYFKKYF